MTSVYSWDFSAGANATADFNMAEGMPPSAVNDGIRQLMARVRAYVGDLGAETVVGGTANVLTLLINSEIGSYQTGVIVGFRPTADNTTTVTMTVNSLGAKAVRKFSRSGDVALVAGDLQAGGTYLAVYDAAANSAAGAWVLINPALGAVAYLDAINDAAWSGAALTVANGGTGGTTQASARTGLGLGAASVDNVVTVAHGGTGGATQAAARTGLGLGGLAVLDAADQTYTGASTSNVAYPVSSYLLAFDDAGADRNQTVTVRLGGSDTLSYTVGAGGLVLTGTWKARGRVGGGTLLVQRVA